MVKQYLYIIEGRKIIIYQRTVLIIVQVFIGHGLGISTVIRHIKYVTAVCNPHQLGNNSI